MKKRFLHKSTLLGIILIAAGLFVGFRANQWDVATMIIATGCGAVGYAPKKNEDCDEH